jgi:glutathione synthase/RimK-type ligase-like ATP-grasp enzyme
MSSIGVFFDDPGFDAYPFDDPEYRQSYGDLAKAIRSRGGEFVILRGSDTYMGGNLFSGGWRFTGDAYVRTDDFVTVDLIYNKGATLKPDDDARIVNKAAFDAVCAHKMRTYALFPELFPRTVLAGGEAEALEAIASMKTDILVLKPAEGWGGKKVWIGPKKDAHEYLEPYPVMIQEYIDTSGGIPGITDGKHDFRLIMMNDRVLLTYARLPAEGGYISNVSKGGSVRHVPIERRPAAAVALAQNVDRALASYGDRLYSIDCGLDKSGEWKIIELNDHPGLSPRGDCGEEADAYYGSLADFFLACAQSR